jgi:lysozyme
MTRPYQRAPFPSSPSMRGAGSSAYPDPGTGGAPWTIGYGHTGPDVTPGKRITETQATDYLRSDLAIAARRVEKKIGAVIDELSAGQFCAC